MASMAADAAGVDEIAWRLTPRCRSVRAEQRRELVRGYGRAEVVTLHLVARAFAQERLLLGRLDAFGDDRQAQGLTHRDDRLGNRAIFRVARDLADEGAVDLQRVDREALQMRERRVARAEIVDREPDTERLDRAQNLHGALGVVHDHAFRDLDLEQRRIHSGLAQNAVDLAREPFVVQLAHRQVHRHLYGRQSSLLPRDVLSARRAQDPSADRHDQPGLLREGYELRGRDGA